MVVYTCNPNSWEAEAGELWVPGQIVLHRKRKKMYMGGGTQVICKYNIVYIRNLSILRFWGWSQTLEPIPPIPMDNCTSHD
jgi:hypothetical protein